MQVFGRSRFRQERTRGDRAARLGHAYRPTHRRFTDEQILAVVDDAARAFDGDLAPSRYGTYVSARREQAQREAQEQAQRQRTGGPQADGGP